VSALRRSGFTLVEVLVALTLLAVGLLGATATLLAARRAVASAERLHIAAQAGAGVADSLLDVRAASAGQRDADWGTLRWTPADGGLRLVAEDAAGVTLLEWWFLTNRGPS
jgi:type IV pilus modification protein PilV